MSNVEISHNLETAREMLRWCLNKNVPAFLWGPAGIGKTEMTAALAVELDWPMVDRQLSTMDPPDLLGQQYVAGDLLRYAKPEWLVELESFGDRDTIFFLDEMNAGVSQSMLGAALKLIRERRAGPHRLPARCHIVAAGNRLGVDRAAVTKTTDPMNGRFSHIHCAPDNGAWDRWANAHGIDPLLCAYHRFQQKRGLESLNIQAEGGELARPASRTWVEAAKFMAAPPALRVHLFASQVGMAQATEFEGFINLFSSLPKLEDILRDPDNARLPQEIAPAYAICATLARQATRANFAAVVAYARRVGAAISREFETVAVIEAIKRDESLKETPAFIDWAARNVDALT